MSSVQQVSREVTHAIFNRRQLIMFFYGLASGLPLALSGATLQAWFVDADVDIKTIGWLSMVGSPYVFKFLWAPVLDSIAPPLGRRRGWIFMMQLILMGALAYMGVQNPSLSPWFLAGIALVVAFASATQDIAIDAYRTELLSEPERGTGNAIYVGAYRLAMWLSGGFALIFADYYGWRATYFLMAGYLLLSAGITLLAPKTPAEQRKERTQLVLWQPIVEFLKRPYAIAFLVFVLIYKLGDAFGLSLMSAFLMKKGLGFSLTDVGAIYKTVGLAATLLGSFTAGILMARIRLFTALMAFGIAQGVSTGVFMWLAVVGKSYPLMVFSIGLEFFCSGLGTVAFLGLIMQLCDVRFTASQFALLSALASVGRVFTGPIAAHVVAAVGWVWFFFIAVVIAVPGMVLLWFLRSSDVFQSPDLMNQKV